jgi:hypothetical protein
MSTIDHPRARAALARLEALAATTEGADACTAIAAELRRADAAMGRAGAADVRQLVLPLVLAANDDTEGPADD